MVSFVKIDSQSSNPQIGTNNSKVFAPYVPVKSNLAAYEAVADLQVVQAPLPRDLAIITRIPGANPFGPGPLYNVSNTSYSYTNYDTFMAAFNREQEVAGEIATLESEIETDH